MPSEEEERKLLSLEVSSTRISLRFASSLPLECEKTKAPNESRNSNLGVRRQVRAAAPAGSVSFSRSAHWREGFNQELTLAVGRDGNCE